MTLGLMYFIVKYSSENFSIYRKKPIPNIYDKFQSKLFPSSKYCNIQNVQFKLPLVSHWYTQYSLYK